MVAKFLGSTVGMVAVATVAVFLVICVSCWIKRGNRWLREANAEVFKTPFG
jgi:hypothetical protein